MPARPIISRSCLLPRIIFSARSNSKVVPRPFDKTNYPVDSDCIPLTGSYSINNLLTDPSGTGLLSEETLRKLHKLAGLQYPSCSTEDVVELVKVVRGVRSEKVRELLEKANEDFGKIEPGWGRKTVLFDGKEKEDEGRETEDGMAHGIELIKDSRRTSGNFYTVGRRRV